MSTNNKILIVDDDACQRVILHDILKSKGYTPIAVAMGKTALEKAKKIKPAVALIDLRLSDMTGLKVMEGIKKYSAASECIVLTGHATKESAIEAVNLGAFNYILKPYDMEQLLLSIRRAIEKLDARDRLRESMENLAKALKESQQREKEVSALLQGTKAVMKYHKFSEIANSIFDICKKLIGATSGYVAILNQEGTENIVIFLDSGGLDCTVDISLPMPIRGLRAEVYRNKKTIFENDFPNSQWPGLMPDGHVSLDNVMFTPLVIKGQASGLIGLANKPGGFDKSDARLATAFADIAAVALHNSQTLESLEHSEERFRSVSQTAPDAIITVKEDGKIAFWNKAAKTIFGYSAEEALGKPHTLIIPERFHQAHNERIQRFSSTRKLNIHRKTFELTARRKDGTEFPLESSIARWKTKEGTFFTTVGRDITERKLAEDNIRVLAKFPSESPNPVLRIKNNGTVEFANKASWPLLNKLIAETNHFSSDKWKQMIADIYDSKQSYDKEFIYNDRIFSLTFTPIADNNYLYVYGRDITERVQVEKKLRISYTKLQNLSAHLQSVRENERTTIAREIHDELGQLLTALQMDLGNLILELPQYNTALIDKAKSMSELINMSIQTTQKISSDLRPSILDNLGVIPAMKRHAKEFQSHSGMKCTIKINFDNLVLDRDLSTTIFRIFQETLTNVSRHANATWVTTSLKKENERLILKIEDNGRGITEEEIASPKSLGIIGIRERAYFVKGKLQIDGVRGQGTTITVSIPFSEPE